LPNNLNTLRVGFGNYFKDDSPFSYQVYYNQAFTKSNTVNDLRFSASKKILLALFDYTFNPQARLQVKALAGCGVISSYLTVTALNDQTSLTTNTVDVDPIAGGSLFYQLNSKYAVGFVGFWDFAFYNKYVHGGFVPSIMLAYFPDIS